MSNESLLETKIKTLCLGLKTSPNILEEIRKQNPFFEKRGGYSDGAFLTLENKLFVDAPVFNNWVKFSPLGLQKQNGNLIISENGVPLSRAKLLNPPQWYYQKTSDGINMGRIIQQHGPDQLATAVWSYCELFNTGEQCKFCAIGVNKRAMTRKDPRQIIEAVSAALSENPNYEIVMNSGTTLTPDRGANIFIELCRNLSRETNVPIAVEMAPPAENKYFDLLQDSGVEAVMMNLELSNEDLRRLYCPGKARLGTQNRYFEAYKYALKVFGEGQVSSVLLANLERKESTIEGAKKLIETGVIPSILIFRGTDGTILEQYSNANPTDIKEIYENVSRFLKMYGLNPKNQTGCMKCGGCSLEGDYYNLKIN
jgi:radical SAM protein (TIGR04043 family)